MILHLGVESCFTNEFPFLFCHVGDHIETLTMPKTIAHHSNETANSSLLIFHSIFRPSPELHLPSLTDCNISLLKFNSPAFFPVTKFQSLMHFSPLPTLSMSFMLGCTAKSFTPDGEPPGGAVSPLGLP